MPEPSRTMNRRRFVTLVALSGAAALTSPLSPAAAPGAKGAGTAAPAGRRPLTAAMRREIASQEKSLAEQLEAIRKFELPPGSPMAFVFTPLRARRGR